MKMYWKWILGVIVVMALVFAAGFVFQNFTGNFMGSQGFDRFEQADGFYYRGPMMGGFEGWRGNFDRGYAPMMGGHAGFYSGRFMPFFGGFMFLGGLLHLAIPIGALYLAYWFGKQAGMKTVAAPAAMEVAAPEAEAPKKRASK